MIRVDNKKTIANLEKKSFGANKTRNIIATIAIALTAILFTSLFTMGIGMVETIQNASIRQAGGDGHAVLKYITEEEFSKVKNHDLIKEIAYDLVLADNVENEQLSKRHTEFWYYDSVGLKLGFAQPTTGHIPKKENEVIADTKTLQLLGVPEEMGAPITLDLEIKGEKVTRNFILCGWWESDDGFNVGQVFSSKAYVDAHRDELANTYYEDHFLTGAINAYIMFDRGVQLENKLERVITESGFSMDDTQPNYIASNVNWAYLGTNFGMDAGTMLSLGFGILLIILTGYLIIYNIFQISVIRDIRFYGLLKTIGTTGKQIRTIIRRQAFRLCLFGTPIGLLLGYFSGKALVPLLMSNSSYGASNTYVSPNPLIFIVSTIFVLVTVSISTKKPSKIAANVSPVEAVKYTDTSTSKITKVRKRTKGANVLKMAFANLGRNKKRTILSVISLSLSIVLLSTVLTLSNSLDLDKFVSKFIDSDFLVAHVDYFNNEFFGPENEVSTSLIDAVNAQDGFQGGGRLYGGRSELITVTDTKSESTVNKIMNGYYIAACYGLEDFPLNKLELLDGEIDKEKLNSGKYILEGVKLDDNGSPMWDTANFKVGETVTLHKYQEPFTGTDNMECVDVNFTVLGHVAIKTYTNSDRISWGYTFYLPANIYKSLVTNPAIMSYVFDVDKEKENSMEDFLKSYTNAEEPMMNYESKATTAASFSGMRNTVLFVGGALSIVIGIIGILNFINSILTSIITRKREFAMLQSIGMAKKQLSHMLCYEGLCYAVFTGITVLVLGVITSQIVVKPLCTQLWFMSYKFIMWPLFLSIPILIILGILVPAISFSTTGKHSIVERLREAE